MSDARSRELWGRLLAGRPLTAQEETELLQALEADDELRAEFVGDAQMDGLLRTVDRADQDSADFNRGVLQCLSAQEDGGRFIARVQTRLKEAKSETPRGLRRVRLRRRPGSASGPAWAAALVAAAVLIVVLAFALAPGDPIVAPSETLTHRPEPVEETRPALPEAPEPAVARNPATPPPRPGTPARSPREKFRPDDVLPPESAPKPAVARPDTPKPRTTESRPAATAVAAVILERVRGTVRIGKKNAESSAPLREGEGIVTGPESEAVLRFTDSTRVTLGADTELRDVRSAGAKQVFVAAGRIRADVAKQPLMKPMVFSTPHGKATVLGTKFSLDVRPEGYTHLRVDEGRVRLTRGKDRRSVLVTGGHYAVAGAGPLKSKPFPVDQIVLLPAQARLTGNHWAVVRDPEASGGTALEGRKTAHQTSPATAYVLVGPRNSYATFLFDADPGKTYHVWIRGRTMAKTRRNYCDEVVIEPADAQVSRTEGSIQSTDPGAALYKGFSRTPGYGWVGGNGEGNKDAIPITIRFRRPGRQVLRVYCVEPVTRVDAIWLSATQLTRPADDQFGPR